LRIEGERYAEISLAIGMDVARCRPGLKLFDACVAARAFHDPFFACIVDTVHGTKRHTKATVNALIEHDGEAPEKIPRHRVDGVDLARASVIARPTANAGLIDVKVTDSCHLVSPAQERSCETS